MTMNGIVVGVDGGGTQFSVVPRWDVTDRTLLGPAHIFEVSKHTRQVPGDFGEDFGKLIAALEAIEDEYGQIRGIGLGLPGKPSPDGTHLVMAGNLHH